MTKEMTQSVLDQIICEIDRVNTAYLGHGKNKKACTLEVNKDTYKFLLEDMGTLLGRPVANLDKVHGCLIKIIKPEEPCKISYRAPFFRIM
jgi:hypothetical protein